jgi:hypothetical protein
VDKMFLVDVKPHRRWLSYKDLEKEVARHSIFIEWIIEQIPLVELELKAETGNLTRDSIVEVVAILPGFKRSLVNVEDENHPVKRQRCDGEEDTRTVPRTRASVGRIASITSPSSCKHAAIASSFTNEGLVSVVAQSKKHSLGKASSRDANTLVAGSPKAPRRRNEKAKGKPKPLSKVIVKGKTRTGNDKDIAIAIQP